MSGENIHYQLVRSQRKTLSLQVVEGCIKVRSPYGLSDPEINLWVQSKSTWIKKQVAIHEKKCKEKPSIADGGSCLFLGERKNICIKKGVSHVEVADDDLVISAQEAQHESVFKAWLQHQAVAFIEPRCIALAKRMDLQAELKSVRFRYTKSRWGHCTAEGTIQFNWVLIMAPLDVIDYVIFHELSHLVHMNHSTKFWRHVERYCIDYTAQKKWLQSFGHQLSI